MKNKEILLQFRINKIKPNIHYGYWYPSAAWLMVKHPSVTRGSRVWNRIMVAWRRLTVHIEPSPPTNSDEVLSTSLWWSLTYIGSNFNFFQDRARVLARNGMRTIGDL